MVIRLSGGILTYLVESFSGAHIFANYKYRSGGRPYKGTSHQVLLPFIPDCQSGIVSSAYGFSLFLSVVLLCGL